LHGGGISLVSVKHPQSAPSPKRHEIGWGFTLMFIILSLKSRRKFEERPEQRGAIVIQQLDQAGLPHQREVAGFVETLFRFR